ncbi:pilus assembly protein PilP [Herbaspirillum chlorophenolicum]|uniref:pilus assembly protein PilP n=1 Tax=Herbaspirillum chlorophenolicum TaxID=211589 RepID=UPI000A81B153|nr:pilus assembly protein PilP [Herbaspirillum chlorophenolicum]
MTPTFVSLLPACLPVYLFATGLLAGCGAADQTEAVRAWIAQARHDAISRVQAPAPSQPEQTDTEAIIPTDVPADPFGMVQRRAAHRQATAHIEEETGNGTGLNQARPAEKSEPHIRVLGTLVQETSAYAVLQIDGRSLRVRVGDELPAELGRIVHVDEQSVKVTSRGATQVLAVGRGDPQESASDTQPLANKVRQPRQRQLVRP